MDAPEDVCFAFLDALTVGDFDAVSACLEPEQATLCPADFVPFLELRRAGRLVALPTAPIKAPFHERVVLGERGGGRELRFMVHLTDRWRIESVGPKGQCAPALSPSREVDGRRSGEMLVSPKRMASIREGVDAEHERVEQIPERFGSTYDEGFGPPSRRTRRRVDREWD